MNRVGIALCLLIAAACRRESPLPSDAEAPVFPAQPAERIAALGYSGGATRLAPEQKVAASPAGAPNPAKAPSSSPLKLIRTGTLDVEVKDFKAAAEEATRIAARLGGYVSDRESTEEASGRTRGRIVLRIPASGFEGAVGALRGLGRVRAESARTEDVTKAYADLETRLAVKREAAARLREILIRQTGKVSEVLSVEREIARVVEEIEQAEGERRYFDNQVSLSTITLALFEPSSMVAPGALEPIVSALRRAAGLMSESVAELIELAASALPWVIALVLVFKWVRWRRRPRG
jgi:hypothetical protein